ncbi:23S rRNA (cytosine1962-C5)-methyltransferase [Catalinimonas alkaloidigena]|uniref:23S rRNA (Cytosine1962-C5)-methyltransferase n=1 Tax=Catalinimonas alkaloidigena TaxID=1075417 RepID=A0A1G9BKN4_9BACT|nr:class I SAM-dependent methyltransferase [Catalinimonas alkaloidigena]SDK39810.1 23S rRNA (cytosine1962-C5)-methyltransferase [Catalinimonas alkaloidigena]
MQLLTPTHWRDYRLLDSGGFEKLEQFGPYVLIRPEPQAVWDRALSEKEWQQRAHATFTRDKNSQERGEWHAKPGMTHPWMLDYEALGMRFRFRLTLPAFKHVGIFPEQAANWEYIYEHTQAMVRRQAERVPKVLNLFAYTGGASLAAKAAGADVTHVDAVKQVITWSRENMELSGLQGIRWVVEDALKFVKREVRRGNRYQGIILDPPAYGRGPAGEKWLIEEHLNEMLKLCADLLDPDEHFFVINLYSLGFSALIVENLITTTFPQAQHPEFGELYLPDQSGKKLPLGTFYRFWK